MYIIYIYICVCVCVRVCRMYMYNYVHKGCVCVCVRVCVSVCVCIAHGLYRSLGSLGGYSQPERSDFYLNLGNGYGIKRKPEMRHVQDDSGCEVVLLFSFTNGNLMDNVLYNIMTYHI